MKKLIVAVAALTAISGVAVAADMPTKAPAAVVAQTWTGAYIGGNVGGVRASFDPLWIADPAFFPFSGPGIAEASRNRLSDTGVIAGGQIGYNWQSGSSVAGIEADFNYTGIEKDRTTLIGGFLAGTGSFLTQTVRSHWLSTIRGRLGFVAAAWVCHFCWRW